MATPKHFLDLDQVDPKTLRQILDHGKAMKKQRANGGHEKPLAGKTLAMIFEKPSTRTRVSFEAGMHQLGGAAIYLFTRDSQLGRGEPVEDAAQVISRMCDVIMVRTFEQDIINRFAGNSRDRASCCDWHVLLLVYLASFVVASSFHSIAHV